MNAENNHDDLLFEMLKECKTLPKFLDQVFGFLSRRTDFYVVAEEDNATVGLPKGLAEKLVRHTFLRWKHPTPVVYSDDLKVASEETVTAEEIVTADECPSSTKKNVSNIEENFTPAESYNGSVQENYCWSQSITDVDITVKLPKDCVKKNLIVKILPEKIMISIKNKIKLLEGNLCRKCKANDAIWSVENQKLQIHLDKCQEAWWNCLIKTEQHLDLSKIDCSRPYDELTEEEQTKIEELAWNCERKRLGLPTSEELQMQETLKKAWNAEGSPFSGPFDPNAVNFGL